MRLSDNITRIEQKRAMYYEIIFGSMFLRLYVVLKRAQTPVALAALPRYCETKHYDVYKYKPGMFLVAR